MQLLNYAVTELSRLLQKGEISSGELTEAYLTRIESTESVVGAWLTVLPEVARQAAARADESLAAQRKGGEQTHPLTGIPLGLKDNICYRGAPTTCASRVLEGYRPPYDATVTEKLQTAGGVTLGKLNMDEFAMGSSTENSGFHPTHNPWRPTCVPGGSSGGSAAAVAARQTPYALGSDTGGSIRQPASFCGVVGMKPTYGAVSRYGLVAFASSLDQIGPLTRDVRDNALVLDAIAGYDGRDSTSVPGLEGDYGAELEKGVKGMRIGLPQEFFTEGLSPEVGRAVRHAAEVLEKEGATLAECSLPHMRYALPAYYLIAPAECSSNLARYDGVRYGLRAEASDMISMSKETRAQGFGAEVKRRIMLGSYALSSGYYDAYYIRSQKVRTLIKEDFDRLFTDFDALLCPTAPTVAFAFGAAADPLTLYLGDIYTIPVNLAGLPALSLPVGLADGLPVGTQLIAAPFAERTLYRVAYALEQALPRLTLPEVEVI